MTVQSAGAVARFDISTVQAFIDALPFYAMVIDEGHLIVAANQAFASATGVPINALVRQYCPEVVHHMDQPFPGCPLEDAAIAGRCECRVLREHDRWFKTEVFPLPGRTPDGGRWFLHWAQDVTEMKSASEALANNLEQQLVLSSMLRSLQETASEVRVLEIAIDSVRTLTWLGPRASASAFLRRGAALHLVAHRELSEPLLERCRTVREGACICGDLARCAAALADGVEFGAAGASCADTRHLVLPVVAASRTLAVLGFHAPSEPPLDEGRADFLRIVAAVTAAALVGVRQQVALAHNDRLRTIGILTAGLAHEISNPLTSVLSGLSGLKEQFEARWQGAGGEQGAALADGSAKDGASVETAEMLDHAWEAAERIRQLVLDVKMFSRSRDEAGEAVSLNAIAASSGRIALPRIKPKARLVIELGDIPSVRVPEGRLAQVVLNLLINAADALPKDNPQHHEILLRTWAEHGEVCLEVRDSGCGIAPENLKRLFEPFFTTKSREEGTGLGLSICYDIVTACGGRIDVQSEVAVGTSFVVRLPAADSPD